VKLLRPLRERDFALLWTGMTVSLLGDGIFIVAEAWQVYDIDNDPVALSLVGLAWTGGMTAFLLTGGIVSDRVERRKVLIAADLVRALVLARPASGCSGRPWAASWSRWSARAARFLIDAGTFATSAACIWGLRVRSLPAPGVERSARRELREGDRLRALAAVAVGDAGGGLAEPAAVPGPAGGAAAVRRAQRPPRGGGGLRRSSRPRARAPCSPR
jgi:MFS family permease